MHKENKTTIILDTIRTLYEQLKGLKTAKYILSCDIRSKNDQNKLKIKLSMGF